MKSENTGVARIIAAAGFSIAGIRSCWRNEAAFRQECILALLLLVPSFFVARSGTQWLLLISPLFLLLMLELLNSAVEAVVDRIGAEFHELSGLAKDVASASVFLCLILIPLSWGVIIWENFF